MGSQEETLKLVAQVTDSFSKPMTDLRRQLQATAELMDRNFKVTHKNTALQNTAFGQMKKGVTEAGQAMSGVLNPAMSAFGLTSLSVAGALAMVAKSVYDFTQHADGIHVVSNITGIAADQVKLLGEQYTLAGGNAADFRSQLAGFSREMLDVHWRLGSYQTMAAQGMGDLAEKLHDTQGEAKQLDLLMTEFMNAGPDKRKLLAEDFPILQQYLGRTKAEIAEIQSAAKAMHVEMTADEERLGKEGAEAWRKIGVAIDNAKNKIGITVLEASKILNKTLPEIVNDANKSANERSTHPQSLPPLDIPGMATGGHISRDGLIYAHAGEDIIRKSDAVQTQSGATSQSDSINIIAVGTRKGVTDGLWDFYNARMGVQGGAGETLLGGGDAAAPGGRRGGGLGSKVNADPMGALPGLDGPGDAVRPGDKGAGGGGEADAVAPGGRAAGGGSPYRAAQRAKMFAEYDKWTPAQKRTLANVERMENSKDPAGVLESLANRTIGEKGTKLNRGGTLWEGLSGHFYSSFRSSLASANAGHGSIAQADATAAAIRGGRDDLGGRTDQGMLSDPGHRAMHSGGHLNALGQSHRLKHINGEWYSDKQSISLARRDKDLSDQKSYDASALRTAAGKSEDATFAQRYQPFEQHLHLSGGARLDRNQTKGETPQGWSLNMPAQHPAQSDYNTP